MHANLLAAASSATASFHTPHINYLSILPILIMMGGAIVLMGVSSLLRKIFGVGVGTWGTVVISVAALVAAIVQWHDVTTHGAKVTIAGAIAYDGFSVFIQIVVSITILLTALIGDGYLRREGIEGCEFHVLAMLSASGAMLMGSANDLIVVFLGLEILSIALYVLTAFNHKRAESGEAALKYFVLGAFSSAIFVYGIALAYGATGTTNLPQIASYLSKNVVASNGVLLAGLALLLVGFGFKIAAVPFHMWSPDVYQGAPSPITGFMAAVAKAGAFAALLRVFVSSFGVVRTDWQPIVWGLAILTLVVGAVLALVQRDVKRMMAYSSINHAGFILLGVQAADARGVSASLYYLFAYMFMVMGTFAVITVIGRVGDTGHQLSDYRGLARRQPVLAGAFAVFLLAQAGIPFTTGFLAKFQVVAAAVDVHSYALAVVAMVSAAIAAFFYLRVGITMYSPVGPVGDPIPGEVDGAPAATGSPVEGAADPAAEGEALTAASDVSAERPGLDRRPGEAERTSLALMTEAPAHADVAHRVVKVPALTWVAISLCGAFTVVFGIIPQPIIDFAHQATLLFV
ncbi:MAG TPA: NADH-quinone oxidoreductase subunit N [Acidimicrobiales bacterium]|jgi:NADH-quinone oxidoreductase subunit N|nr:NADH-quinone oxidoreductase subunit N [Acidimicrobiales bacterium]